VPFADASFIPDILDDLEAKAEAAGWDRPSTLYAMCAHAIDGTVGAVTLAPFPSYRIAASATGHSYAALLAVAGTLREQPAEIRNVILGDMAGLRGLVLVDEAWVVKATPGEPHPTGSLKDVPGRSEQRFVLLVCADGSTKTLTRARGEAPSYAGKFGSGRLLDAMRALLATALEG
jgi:hypothetical protein